MSDYHYCAEGTCVKHIPLDRQYCPAHELHYPDMEHHHEYVIPIEWVETYEHNENGTGVAYTEKRVTKLACSCGEERDRSEPVQS